MSDKATVESKKRKKYASRLYPKDSLKDALKIAQAIKDYSAGKPYDRLDLAKAFNISPGVWSFRSLITSSGRYGLTTGSYNSKQIALTPLGTSIMYPKDPQEEADCLKTALFNIPLFRKFFTDYDNNKLPNVEFLENTLNRTYGIPVEDSKECYEILVKNAKELDILEDLKGSFWIHLARLSKAESARARAGLSFHFPPNKDAENIAPIAAPTVKRSSYASMKYM